MPDINTGREFNNAFHLTVEIPHDGMLYGVDDENEIVWSIMCENESDARFIMDAVNEVLDERRANQSR